MRSMRSILTFFDKKPIPSPLVDKNSKLPPNTLPISDKAPFGSNQSVQKAHNTINPTLIVCGELQPTKRKCADGTLLLNCKIV